MAALLTPKDTQWSFVFEANPSFRSLDYAVTQTIQRDFFLSTSCKISCQTLEIFLYAFLIWKIVSSHNSDIATLETAPVQREIRGRYYRLTCMKQNGLQLPLVVPVTLLSHRVRAPPNSAGYSSEPSSNPLNALWLGERDEHYKPRAADLFRPFLWWTWPFSWKICSNSNILFMETSMQWLEVNTWMNPHFVQPSKTICPIKCIWNSEWNILLERHNSMTRVSMQSTLCL